MKNLWKFGACMVALTIVSCTGDPRPISPEQLPEEAKQFVAQHFGAGQAAYASEEAEIFTKTYEVGFLSGDRIEFDRNGRWMEVDCPQTEVPQSVLPLPVAHYLQTHYPQAVVRQIERWKRGCEVTLDNGFELRFDDAYRLVEIDN